MGTLGSAHILPFGGLKVFSLQKHNSALEKVGNTSAVPVWVGSSEENNRIPAEYC